VTDLVLETPEGVVLRFELAGPGTRILAAALDALLFWLTFAALALFLSLVGLVVGVVLLLTGAILLLVAYSFLFSLALGGRTPGKLWTGIRVCDAQGFAPRTSQLLLRALFVPLEMFLILPVPLVWILIATTPRRQRLGDLVAGTLVLRDRAPRVPREPAPGLRWSELESRVFALEPAVARGLSGHDLGFLRDLLTRTDLEASARTRLFSHAARHYAARTGLARRDLSPGEARTFLRELFLLLREVRAGNASAPAPPAAAAAARGAPRASGSALR
jgi:uncharacterized RDD family membrane protein YckC